MGQPCHAVGMSKLSVLYLVGIVLLRELQCINGKSIVTLMARLLNSFDAGLLNIFINFFFFKKKLHIQKQENVMHLIFEISVFRILYLNIFDT